MAKFLQFFMTLVSLLVPLIIDAESPGNGADKKAKVISDLKDILVKEKILVPSFLAPVEDIILGMLVDALVSKMNKMDFFGKSGS